MIRSNAATDEHVENEIIELNAIKSENNGSDMFTTNLGPKHAWINVLKIMDWVKNTTGKKKAE